MESKLGEEGSEDMRVGDSKNVGKSEIPIKI